MVLAIITFKEGETSIIGEYGQVGHLSKVIFKQLGLLIASSVLKPSQFGKLFVKLLMRKIETTSQKLFYPINDTTADLVLFKVT